MDPRLAALLDKQEIEEVVLRYCRGIDRRDFELVRSCYHPDARDRHGSFDGTVDEYIAWVDGLTARYRFTMHLVGNVLIELGDADVAACETYGVSLHASDDPRPFMNMATGFRYVLPPPPLEMVRLPAPEIRLLPSMSIRPLVLS